MCYSPISGARTLCPSGSGDTSSLVNGKPTPNRYSIHEPHPLSITDEPAPTSTTTFLYHPPTPRYNVSTHCRIIGSDPSTLRATSPPLLNNSPKLPQAPRLDREMVHAPRQSNSFHRTVFHTTQQRPETSHRQHRHGPTTTLCSSHRTPRPRGASHAAHQHRRGPLHHLSKHQYR